MKRLVVIALFALLWVPLPALAEEGVVKPVVTLIEKQGYAVTDISRTWLGRILITAQNDQYLREIVLNRTTDQIIRDRVFFLKEPKGDSPLDQDGATGRDDALGGALDGVAGTVDDVTGAGVALAESAVVWG